MEEPTSTEFSDPDDARKQNQAPEQPRQVDQTHQGGKINKNFIERTRWTILMLVGFVFVIACGQIACCLLILIVSFLVFKEINSIKRNYEKEASIPITKFINWYFYGIANFYCLGWFINKTFPMAYLTNTTLSNLLNNHSFVCFCGFIIGFVVFVLSLKQGYLKYQFRIFAWIILATIMVVFQTWFMMANVMKGMIWFVLPTILIICNDIFAYLVGYFFGSHQLIALSPKKTWEGYIGGAIITLIFSYILTSALVTIPGFICPLTETVFTPFEYPICENGYLISESFLSNSLPIPIMNIHIHAFFFSLFASVVGPFGGFFASGLKRSIKIKDFSNLIPGHGGLSDRMDCQMIMGSFAYFYLTTFLEQANFNPNFWLDQLNSEQQLLLFEELKRRVIQINI